MKDEKRPNFIDKNIKKRNFKAYSTSTLEDVKNDFKNAFKTAATSTIQQAREDINVAIETAKKRSATILEESRKFGDSVLEMQRQYESEIGNAIKDAEMKFDDGGVSKFSPFIRKNVSQSKETEDFDEDESTAFDELAYIAFN